MLLEVATCYITELQHESGILDLRAKTFFTLSSCCYYRLAGGVIGTGFSNFITDWDKVSATVSITSLICCCCFL